MQRIKLFLVIVTSLGVYLASPVYAQNLGVNYNGAIINVDVPDLGRTETRWMRIFIDYFDYKEGRQNINTNPGLARVEAAKSAGYRIILSLKFNYTNRDFPTSSGAIDADLDYLPVILNRLYGDIDIIVAGNEPFIESKPEQKDNRLVEYYKRAAMAVKSYVDAQTRKVPIYIGAFNRLWLESEQTQAVKDYLAFARNTGWIAGADLHIHHDNINQITAAFTFVDNLLRGDQQMLITEFSLMRHWKNMLNQAIPAVLSSEYGREPGWKVYQYLDYTLNTSPVSLEEWLAFLQNSTWFESRKHYLSNAWNKFLEFPKFHVATYAMYQTYGNDPFTLDTDPWILNGLFVNRTVVPDSNNEFYFNYGFIDDFVAIQQSTVLAVDSEAAMTVEEDKLTVYPNPAGQHLNIKGVKGTFVIFSTLGQPVGRFEGDHANIADLAAGVYVIRHASSGKTEMFVKD
jgi:hypothetical protein